MHANIIINTFNMYQNSMPFVVICKIFIKNTQFLLFIFESIKSLNTKKGAGKRLNCNDISNN